MINSASLRITDSANEMLKMPGAKELLTLPFLWLCNLLLFFLNKKQPFVTCLFPIFLLDLPVWQTQPKNGWSFKYSNIYFKIKIYTLNFASHYSQYLFALNFQLKKFYGYNYSNKIKKGRLVNCSICSNMYKLYISLNPLPNTKYLTNTIRILVS